LPVGGEVDHEEPAQAGDREVDDGKKLVQRAPWRNGVRVPLWR
jgi:hypothetical protein